MPSGNSDRTDGKALLAGRQAIYWLELRTASYSDESFSQR